VHFQSGQGILNLADYSINKKDDTILDMNHHTAAANTSLLLLYIGIVIVVAAIIGYVYASRLNRENTSRLKKEQKVALKKKNKTARLVSHALLIIGIILCGTFIIQQTVSKYNLENLNFDAPIQVTDDKDYGQGHAEGTLKYEMKIPTSGIHSPHDLKFGFYTEKPPIEKLVHNLEHGDIIIYYKPDADATVMDQIKTLIHYKRAGSGVLGVPNPDIPSDKQLVVNAWTKTMELTSFNEEQIGTFIYKYINKGPEVIPPEVRQNGGTM
jgi:hypothetical protein